jgi:hypothetical protein
MVPTVFEALIGLLVPDMTGHTANRTLDTLIVAPTFPDLKMPQVIPVGPLRFVSTFYLAWLVASVEWLIG